ncbi:MAG TPA: hypothetical protein VHU85_17820 [Acidimicrobiales bacterium]|nr:hypothetical protein [Acidimicrobiales bacterium]
MIPKLDSQVNAEARIGAAVQTLASALMDEERDLVFAAEGAVLLLDAALRDLKTRIS